MGSERSLFEVGCGGGKYLVMFGLKGWKCVGLDCSREVLQRAERYIEEVKNKCDGGIDIRLVRADFLEYIMEGSSSFDIVFNAGVIEHFLDETERLEFLKKKFELAKPGGYVISIIPNGMHYRREKVRGDNLGGYHIPEINFSPALIEGEMDRCGGRDIKVIPHNIFGYLRFDGVVSLPKILRVFLYYLAQLAPDFIWPRKFALRHSLTLIGIARK